MKAIKINDETICVEECSIQLSTEKHATIYMSFDTSKSPNSYDIFLNLYESRTVFDISHPNFDANKSIIKTIDIDFGSRMSINLRCSELITKDLAHHRAEIIDELIGTISFARI